MYSIRYNSKLVNILSIYKVMHLVTTFLSDEFPK